MMKLREELKLPLDLPRCCYESFTADPIRDPVEGLEFACHHCQDLLVFKGGSWVWVPWKWLHETEKIEP